MLCFGRKAVKPAIIGKQQKAAGVNTDTALNGGAIIVTGATGPSGRVLVAALAGAGANIAAVDNSQEELQALAVEVAGTGAPGRVLAMAADLTVKGMCRRVVSRAALAFSEIGGLILDAAATVPSPPVFGRQPALPFWEFADPAADANASVDIGLSLAAPAVRQFRARGWGRLVVVAAEEAGTALRHRLAEWAAALTESGVTANLLLDDADADRTAAAIRWLMSAESDGFNGRCLKAALWDPTLPAEVAAAAAAGPVA